jgi:hypothetical protein
MTKILTNPIPGGHKSSPTFNSPDERGSLDGPHYIPDGAHDGWTGLSTSAQDNRYPTVPPIDFESSDPSDAAKADNGVRPWQSHANPEESYSIDQMGGRFTKQGNIPARKQLNAGEGTIEIVKGQDQ